MTFAIWCREELPTAIAFDAKLRRAAESLDGETADRLAAELRPPGIGKAGRAA